MIPHNLTTVYSRPGSPAITISTAISDTGEMNESFALAAGAVTEGVQATVNTECVITFTTANLKSFVLSYSGPAVAGDGGAVSCVVTPYNASTPGDPITLPAPSADGTPGAVIWAYASGLACPVSPATVTKLVVANNAGGTLTMFSVQHTTNP